MKNTMGTNGFYKINKFFSIFFSLILVIYLCYQLSFRKIDFNQIAKCSTSFEFNIYYSKIIENDIEYLSEHMTNMPEKFDFENHTYIITFGYEMEKIKYSPFSKPPHYKDNLNYDCIPKIYLNEGDKNVCYIYELEEKINIDYNMHKTSDKVYFK